MTKWKRTPRRRSYRRAISTRAILNKTSVKKRDVRSVLTSLNAGGVDTAQGVNNPPISSFTVAPANMNGVVPYRFLYIPTATSLITDGLPNWKSNDSRRTATTCYWVGVKERLQLVAQTGHPWRLRRICFTLKGFELLQSTTGDAFWNNRVFIANQDGNFRVMTPLSPGVGALNNILFEGTPGLDWQQEFLAKVDTTRVKVMFDRTRIFNSGNNGPHVHNVSFWHKMRKNLVYDDEEDGGTMRTSSLSTRGNPGMGDYYIYDIWECIGGNSESLAAVSCNSVNYWHEK